MKESEILEDAKRIAGEQERAIAQAWRRCEALEAQLRETLSALRTIEEAARAHALATARIDAHLANGNRGEPGDSPAAGE